MQSFTFGDNPIMADELLQLVLIGKKTATCWAATNKTGANPVGTHMIIKDSLGRERAVIETIECNKRRFNEVDESFAHDEGEGDRTLAYWRKEHQDYFTREGLYTDTMEVFCERFKLVKIIEV